MMTSGMRPGQITEEVLGAYIDGELDEGRRMEVEAYLASDPEAAEFVENARRLNWGLHQVFDQQLATPLPSQHEELAFSFQHRMAGLRRRRFYHQLMAACVALVIVGAAGILGLRYFSGDIPGQQMFAYFEQQQQQQQQASQQQQNQGEAQLASNESGKTSGEQSAAITDVAQEQQEQQQTGEQQQQQQPKPRSNAPDFSEFGFNLISTRFLAKQDGRSMQLIYEAKDGSRVELFYSPTTATDKTSLTLMEEGPIAVLFWHNNGHSYSLIGEVGREPLLAMGKVVNSEWTISLPDGGKTQSGTAKEEPAQPEKSDSGGNGEQEKGAKKDGQDGQEGQKEDGTLTPEDLQKQEKKDEQST